MKHLLLSLLLGSMFTACMTQTDKAVWQEAKDHFSSSETVAKAAPEKAPSMSDKLAVPTAAKDAKEAKSEDKVTPPKEVDPAVSNGHAN